MTHNSPSQWAEAKVLYRMDPTRAPDWAFHRGQPRPFWLDPQRQTIGLGDDRVWTHVPICDPAWRLT